MFSKNVDGIAMLSYKLLEIMLRSGNQRGFTHDSTIYPSRPILAVSKRRRRRRFELMNVTNSCMHIFSIPLDALKQFIFSNYHPGFLTFSVVVDPSPG